VQVVHNPETRAGVWTWVFRVVLALAALSAPIIVFRIFTESELPDPQEQQRLREARSPAP
jgi:hypothetical protein